MRELVVAGLLVSSISAAEPTRNIELTVFDPTPTTAGTSFHVQNANVGKSGELVISTSLSYASNPLVLGTSQNDDPVVRHRTMLALGGAYAFGSRLEAGARMPFYMQSGAPVVATMPGQTPVFSVPPAEGTVLGDLTLHAKMQLARRDRLLFGTGVALRLPTATDGEFAGTDMPSARALALLSFTPSPLFSIHVNAGAVLRKQVEFANVVQQSGMTWGAAINYRIAHSVFFSIETFGDVIPRGKFDDMGAYSTMATIEGLAGLRYFATQHTSIGIAVGRGLTSGIGAPDLRGVLTFAYTPSARALAPMPKPPAPDPATSDSDYDRLTDATDKCPQQREDKDGFQDDDGCPEADNDNDSVLDEQDKCAALAEDKDGFDDADGCPDPDNDNDGVADGDDKCPADAEKINGNEDDDGCPDKGESLVISNPERLELLESVVFKGTQVSRASANVLGQLARTVRARADIVRIRITVHVQPTKDKRRDQALSNKRANAVKRWLIARGLEEARIEARGFGGTNPLVPPGEKNAAQINDRVELIILERK